MPAARCSLAIGSLVKHIIYNLPDKSNRILHHDNIICLTGQPGDVLSPEPRTFRGEVIIMSTYEELSLIVSIALLIVAILNMKNKK